MSYTSDATAPTPAPVQPAPAPAPGPTLINQYTGPSGSQIFIYSDGSSYSLNPSTGVLYNLQTRTQVTGVNSPAEITAYAAQQSQAAAKAQADALAQQQAQAAATAKAQADALAQQQAQAAQQPVAPVAPSLPPISLTTPNAPITFNGITYMPMIDPTTKQPTWGQYSDPKQPGYYAAGTLQSGSNAFSQQHLTPEQQAAQQAQAAQQQQLAEQDAAARAASTAQTTAAQQAQQTANATYQQQQLAAQQAAQAQMAAEQAQQAAAKQALIDQQAVAAAKAQADFKLPSLSNQTQTISSPNGAQYIGIPADPVTGSSEQWYQIGPDQTYTPIGKDLNPITTANGPVAPINQTQINQLQTTAQKDIATKQQQDYVASIPYTEVTNYQANYNYPTNHRPPPGPNGDPMPPVYTDNTTRYQTVDPNVQGYISPENLKLTQQQAAQSKVAYDAQTPEQKAYAQQLPAIWKDYQAQQQLAQQYGGDLFTSLTNNTPTKFENGVTYYGVKDPNNLKTDTVKNWVQFTDPNATGYQKPSTQAINDIATANYNQTTGHIGYADYKTVPGTSTKYQTTNIYAQNYVSPNAEADYIKSVLDVVNWKRNQDAYARSQAGSNGITDAFAGLDKFVGQVIPGGWGTIATIAGSMIAGPMGAAIANATAGAVKGETPGQILQNAALAYAMAYGTEALQEALSAPLAEVQTGLENGTITPSPVETPPFESPVTPEVATPPIEAPVAPEVITPPEANIPTPPPTVEPNIPVSEGPQLPVQPRAPTDLTSTGLSDSAPGTIYTNADGTQDIVLNSGKTVNYDAYQAAQQTGQPISVDGMMTTGGSPTVTIEPAPPEFNNVEPMRIDISGAPYTEATAPADFQAPEGFRLANNAETEALSNAGGSATTLPNGEMAWLMPATGAPVLPEVVVTATKLGLTTEQVMALGGAAAAVAAVASMGSSGAAAAANTAMATPTPVAPGPTPVTPGPVTPPVVEPPVTPPVVEPPVTPPVVEPPVTPPVVEPPVTPVEPPPTPPNEVPVIDRSVPYTGEYSNESVLSRYMSQTLTYGDILKLVAIGMVAPTILNMLGAGPQTPAKKGYGPLADLQWGTVNGLTQPGLNPGYMTFGGHPPPMYQTTNPVQSQYYWGMHPYMQTMENLGTYNNVPEAPAVPFGVQQQQGPWNAQQFINQTIGTSQYQAATQGSGQTPVQFAPATSYGGATMPVNPSAMLNPTMAPTPTTAPAPQASYNPQQFAVPQVTQVPAVPQVNMNFTPVTVPATLPDWAPGQWDLTQPINLYGTTPVPAKV